MEAACGQMRMSLEARYFVLLCQARKGADEFSAGSFIRMDSDPETPHEVLPSTANLSCAKCARAGTAGAMRRRSEARGDSCCVMPTILVGFERFAAGGNPGNNLEGHTNGTVGPSVNGQTLR